MLDKFVVRARVLRLPDNYLHEEVIRGMCRPMGEILEVQIRLPAGYVGEFVRVRAKINVKKRLTRFVSTTKEEKRVWYQVQYEKLPTFVLIVDYLGTGIRSVDRVSMTSPNSTGAILCWSIVEEEAVAAVLAGVGHLVDLSMDAATTIPVGVEGIWEVVVTL